MLSVQFFLRGIKNAHPEQKLTIYCQLELTGHVRDTPFSTKLKVPKKYWNEGDISEEYIFSLNLKRSLDEIRKEFEDILIIIDRFHSAEKLSYELIMDYFNSGTKNNLQAEKEKKKPKFYAVLIEYVTHKQEVDKVQKNTLKTYRARKNNIHDWLVSEKLMDIKIHQFRHRHLTLFVKWLIGEGRFGKNHRNKHLTLINSVLEYSVNQEYIKYNPIGRLDLSYDKAAKPSYLRPSLRQAILDVSMPHFDKIKDISVFLCHTGFSYIDYLNLKTIHLVDTPLGKAFQKQREKTKVYATPPLLPEAEAIINKYGSIEALPRPDLKDINHDLKFLGALAGITEETVGFELSTSVFRDTFSQMMANEFFIENRVIMFMMGHTNEKQMNNYNEIAPERVFHEIQKGKLMQGGVFEKIIDLLKMAS